MADQQVIQAAHPSRHATNPLQRFLTATEIDTRLLGLGHPLIWVLSLAAGLVVGIGIGALQGVIIAYLRVPAFIVTLGGYLVWRGAAWWVTMGRTVAPMDTTFQLMGGGPAGSIGF